MWHDMFPLGRAEDVPISYVTNGVHLPTWMAPPMRSLLTEAFGLGWERRAADPVMWQQVDEIPDDRALAGPHRAAQRAGRHHPAQGRRRPPRSGRGPRLLHGRPSQAFDPEALTLGFARRLATYKRLNLLVHDASPG